MRFLAILIVIAVSGAPQAQSAGPYEISVIDTHGLTGAPGGRTVPVRIAAPISETAVPVVVFSHGAYSSKDLYDGFIDTWARAGYAVIAPTHQDSTTMGTERFTDISSKWPSRYEDIAVIADRLDHLAALLPERAAPFDQDRLVIAGHSAGGLVALGIAGAALVNPDGQASTALADDRFSAAILISPPGLIPGRLTERSIAQVELPMLVITGTADVARGDTGRTWQWRKEPYDFASDGNKHLLVIEGGDHYLGGAMGRDDLDTDPDLEGLALANTVAIAFLDAYAGGNQEIRRKLTGGRLELPARGRAQLRAK